MVDVNFIEVGIALHFAGAMGTYHALLSASPRTKIDNALLATTAAVAIAWPLFFVVVLLCEILDGIDRNKAP